MSKFRKKRTPKRVLALQDLEQAKSAVLKTLTSVSGQRTYDHATNDFVEWYCSEPRLAFNRTVLKYRIYLEQKGYAPNTINLRLAAVRRVAYEACDSGLLSPELEREYAESKGCVASAAALGTGSRRRRATCCWNGRTSPHHAENGTTPFWRC
jgi:hypothetical protein